MQLLVLEAWTVQVENQIKYLWRKGPDCVFGHFLKYMFQNMFTWQKLVHSLLWLRNLIHKYNFYHLLRVEHSFYVSVPQCNCNISSKY